MTNIECYQQVMLALVAWREARGETDAAVYGVMHTIMVRAKNTIKWEGSNIVGAIIAPFQYSSMTDPSDHQLTVWPRETDGRFLQLMDMAAEVISGTIVNPFPTADSYFDDSMLAHPPKWATPERYVGKIGRLNFYKVL